MRSLILIFFLFSFAQANDQETSKFVKTVSINDTIVALQTASVTYTKGEKSITLVGVVHVGEKSYYEKLNRKFKDFDVVCYELVAPKGTRVEKREESFFNKILKDVLKLEHQLQIVDYSPKNFIHADLSPEEIYKRIEGRGDTQFTILLKAIAEIMQQQNLAKEKHQAEIDILEVLLSPNYLKRILADNLVKSSDNAFGPTLTQILLTDRNEAAMEVVKDQLKTKNKIAVFYGAAHMPDIQKTIISLGFKQTNVVWDTAWNLTPTKEEIAIGILKKLID